jgi:hypothetical protein
MLSQEVGPGFQARAGEVAVDAAHARLADLGDLLKQPARDLGEALSASIRTARRGSRVSEAMAPSNFWVTWKQDRTSPS